MTLPDGCIASGSGRPERRCTGCWIEEREAVAPVGSGDAFLAGFVAARYIGASPGECLAYGVACGAESTQRLGAGLIEPREVDRLVAQIETSASSCPPKCPEVAREAASSGFVRPRTAGARCYRRPGVNCRRHPLAGRSGTRSRGVFSSARDPRMH